MQVLISNFEDRKSLAAGCALRMDSDLVAERNHVPNDCSPHVVKSRRFAVEIVRPRFRFPDNVADRFFVHEVTPPRGSLHSIDGNI